MKKMDESMKQERYPNLILSALGKISPQVRITFLSTILCGLAAHGTGLMNKISYQDDIYNLFGFGATVTSGRWMLHILAWLEGLLFGTGNASLPLFNGLISLTCVGLAGGMLVNLMKIRNRAYCAMLGCIMAAFPVLTALFAYMFTSHPYLIGMLMMTICACLICREGPWWSRLAGILLGGASIGVYQAFLPILPSVILMYDLKLLTREEKKIGGFLRRAGVQMLCVLGVLLFYFAANRFFLAKFQVELSSYMGIDQMGSMSVSSFLSRCGRAYREFFAPARDAATDMYPGSLRILHGLLMAAEGLLALRLLFVTGKRSRGKAVLTALLFALMPLACNLIFVMSEEVHSLMVYGQVMQAVLLVWLLDQAEFRQVRARQAVSLAASLLLAVEGVMYIRFDNQCYLKDTFRQQQAFSYYTTMITRIKSLEGFDPEMELCVLNAWYTKDPTIYSLEELDFIHLNTYEGSSGDFMHMTREYFLQNWLGFKVRWYGGTELFSNPEVQAMPAYPAEGSIRIIDGVVVVKLS